ncbi:MAG: sugar phosphate nucleotidyltransferase [Solirubrobacteraceae bacterium]
MSKGLIMACTSSEEDDLAYRLQGRTRYALPLANRVLVRYAAEALIAAGVQDVAVTVSPATVADVADLIGDGSRFGARFHYLEMAQPSTALQMLSAAREQLGAHPLVVHPGDALITSSLRPVIEEFERSQPDVLLISQRSHSYPEAVRAGVRGTDHREQQLEGLDHVAPAAVISPDALQELDRFTADTPTLGGTVAALAEAGVVVAGRSMDGCWCYAPDCDHLLEANRMILDQLPHIPPEAEPESVRIEGRVAIHPTARLERTTIRGPAVIGGGAEVLDTFIGPYTSVGADARLEGAEIEHSIVMEGASIHHVGQRIEASLIGARAEITRDFGMPTALRLRVGRDSTVTLA